jgi:predicted phage terminase large subunit-like protein
MYSRRMQEVIQSPEYRAVFPDFPYPDKKFNEHEWYLKVTPHQRDPTWRAKGAGSSITGGRADCLTGDTLITTPRGQVPIRELVGREDLPAVMGFDHGFGAVEPRVVVASRTIEAGETLVELTTAAGRRLRGTRDHRVWSGGAYRPLGTLVAGSPLQTLDGSVDRVRSLVEIPPEPVYDLQVEGTRNFYANGLLVHNCIIVDDIVTLKNSSTAYSRASLLSWYRSTLHPILVPGAGKVIIIGTRYYRDDLYGAFIEGGLEPLIYPAEDEFGRIMWHERFDRPFLEQKKNPPEGSLASYASQYLCQPINPEGEVFRRHWFELVEDTPELTEMWWCWDTAISGATHADFTAGVLAGLGKDGNVYIVDVARGQWEPHVAKEKITTCWLRTKEKWGGLLRGTLVEDTKEGRVLQAWMREAKETRSMPVLMVPHGGRDKMSRAAVIIPFCEAGRVKLLRGWWTDAFIEEIMEFTPSKRHRYDDQVDAFTYAVMRLLRLGGRSGGSYQVITGGGLR